jgi:hypothetical protein
MPLRRVEGKSPTLCWNAYCTNDAAPAESRTGGLCAKCKKSDYRERNPLRYAFENIRRSAQKRRIQFSLTLEEFEAFCKETNYLKLKGNGCGFMHVDRKDSTKGYSENNIQILEHSENCSKGNRPYFQSRFGGGFSRRPSNKDNPRTMVIRFETP